MTIKISYFLDNGLPLENGIEINEFIIQCNDVNEFSIKVNILSDETLEELVESIDEKHKPLVTEVDKQKDNFDLWIFYSNKYIVISSIPLEYIKHQTKIYTDLYSSNDEYKISILTNL